MARCSFIRDCRPDLKYLRIRQRIVCCSATGNAGLRGFVGRVQEEAQPEILREEAQPEILREEAQPEILRDMPQRNIMK